MAVASALCKQYVLSIVTDTFRRFLDLLRTKQDDNESHEKFETRFDAKVCKLNSTCAASELPPSLDSFLPLDNSCLDSTQRIYNPSDAALIGSATTDRTAKEILSLLHYSDISLIVRACDEPKKPFIGFNHRGSALYANAGNCFSHSSCQTGGSKQRLTPNPLAII